MIALHKSSNRMKNDDDHHCPRLTFLQGEGNLRMHSYIYTHTLSHTSLYIYAWIWKGIVSHVTCLVDIHIHTRERRMWYTNIQQSYIHTSENDSRNNDATTRVVVRLVTIMTVDVLVTNFFFFLRAPEQLLLPAGGWKLLLQTQSSLCLLFHVRRKRVCAEWMNIKKEEERAEKKARERRKMF